MPNLSAPVADVIGPYLVAALVAWAIVILALAVARTWGARG